MNFRWMSSEALYGLGSHMEDYMNLKGKELYLCQHNLKAMVPVINSTAGYGLLFDAGCSMLFRDTEEVGYVELEAAKQIDYYFMKGKTMDAVIANYRLLTGKSPMMPLYLFGYIQSKERYVSSDDLINTLKQFRQRQIPVDMIVQDWNYWPDGQWGRMSMNPTFYPDKKKLTDEIHAMNAKLMISIWPNAVNSPQTDDFKQKDCFSTAQLFMMHLILWEETCIGTMQTRNSLVMALTLGGVIHLNHWTLIGNLWMPVMARTVMRGVGN
jgi:alpha-D-xyloside xylohydrolase